ncbi:hypothetical protein EDB19DRAFT_653476 [Suillus lakei]|nr:hypothetical protein EDB19DRAFT_653476 [Suillus lakei]
MSFPWFRMTLLGSGLMGLGYLLMSATVPTPEQTYAAMSPDLRRKVDANRAARLVQEQTIKRQIDAQFIRLERSRCWKTHLGQPTKSAVALIFPGISARQSSLSLLLDSVPRTHSLPFL